LKSIIRLQLSIRPLEPVPRPSHASYKPAPDRPDPVSLLEEQAKSRWPELVPIRHGRMLSSPFAFYRGAAYVMASDLAGTPTSEIDVQLCGDAHLANFGGFASPERELLFDVNDFDETLPGPWEWDVKRLAASFEIAGRESVLRQVERPGDGVEVHRRELGVTIIREVGRGAGKLQPLADQLEREEADPGRVTAGARERSNQAGFDRAISNSRVCSSSVSA